MQLYSARGFCYWKALYGKAVFPYGKSKRSKFISFSTSLPPYFLASLSPYLNLFHVLT